MTTKLFGLVYCSVYLQGQIAEMRTGEGKTLVAVLPAFLNALSGGWPCLRAAGRLLSS